LHKFFTIPIVIYRWLLPDTISDSEFAISSRRNSIGCNSQSYFWQTICHVHVIQEKMVY